VTGTARRLRELALCELEKLDGDEETAPKEPLPFFANRANGRREKGRNRFGQRLQPRASTPASRPNWPSLFLCWVLGRDQVTGTARRLRELALRALEK